MTTLYPSLEDMKVHQFQAAQSELAERWTAAPPQPAIQVQAQPRVSEVPHGDGLYGSLYGAVMEEYMDLRLEPVSGPIGFGNQVAQSSPSTCTTLATTGGANYAAPVTGNDVGLARATVNSGAIRSVTLWKNPSTEKTGVKLRDVNKGVFVQFVARDSPASLAGVRFGDQVLQIDGVDVAGMSGDKAMGLISKAANPRAIAFAIRDRPFERTITLHKDSGGHVGFTYRNGKVNAIAKDTSAARNGLLVDQQVMEVNGQNVVGLKDSELAEILTNAGAVVTLTIMPSYIYDHMVKKIGDTLLKRMMDHSVPQV